MAIRNNQKHLTPIIYNVLQRQLHLNFIEKNALTGAAILRNGMEILREVESYEFPSYLHSSINTVTM
jgi:hypothetical protein